MNIIIMVKYMCEEEKKYIYDSIKNNEIDHKLIKSYIISNNISYSKNNNGIFINLSILDDTYIKDIYNLIKTNINNKIYNEREEILTNLNKTSVIYNNIKNNKKLTNKLNIIKDKKYEKINNLSDIQLQIIELSKTI